MSSPMCLRCLTRSLSRIQIISPSPNVASRLAPFSTSRTVSAPVQKKAVAASSTSKQKTGFRRSKKKRVIATGRPPAPGERKAFRKRVVLSNPNALVVSGLHDLNRDNAAAAKLQSYQGKVLALAPATVEALRASEAFKPRQAWGFFRQPASLIRKETVELARGLQEIAQSEGGRTLRKVFFGEQGSGKSVLQLQAMAMAHLKGWVVVHIPEAKDFVNAQSPYQPIQIDGKTMYTQPDLTAKILENLGKANQEVLSKLTLRERHDLPMPVQENIALSRFVELGAKDRELAWPIWKAVWRELVAPSQKAARDEHRRPPVLVAIDGVDHFMRESAYLAADFQLIHAHDLTIVQHMISLLSGRTELPNGGMVLAAVSESFRAATPTFNRCLSERLAVQLGQEPSRWDPYTTWDQRVRDVMANASVQKVGGLSKEEARGIMEYYAQSGILRKDVTDRLVSEKWTTAGGGIIGQIEKSSARAFP